MLHETGQVMALSFYDPDEKVKNTDEIRMVFSHDSNLSFTLVLPPKPLNTFAKKKPKAELFIEGFQADEEASAATDSPYWTGPKTLGRSIKKSIEDFTGALSRENLDEIIASCTKSALKKRFLSLFSKRDYSEKEILEKLLDDGYQAEDVSLLIQKAKEGKLVSDERFADVFIRSKLAIGWGSQKIERELHKKGIVLDEVKGWPEEYFEKTDEVERALGLLQNRSKFREVSNPYEKCVRFLVGKGYRYDIAKQATNRFIDLLKDS